MAEETLKEYRRLLARDVYPEIGHLAVGVITPDHVFDLCQAIANQGSPHHANRTKAVISSVLKYGAQIRLIDSNPCVGLPKWGKDTPRERVPAAGEINRLWHGLESVGLSQAMQIIIKIGIATGHRRRTVAGARKSELVDLNTDRPIWVIPAGSVIDNVSVTRTKSGASHHLPLSPLAAQLFATAISKSLDPTYVFPGPRAKSIHGHIDPHSVSTAVRKARKSLGIDDLRVHDMRRAIASELGEMGAPRQLVQELLHHKDGGVTARVYDRAKRERQLRQIMDLWGQRLVEIISGHNKETGLRWIDDGAENKYAAEALKAQASIAELEAALAATKAPLAELEAK